MHPDDVRWNMVNHRSSLRIRLWHTDERTLVQFDTRRARNFRYDVLPNPTDWTNVRFQISSRIRESSLMRPGRICTPRLRTNGGERPSGELNLLRQESCWMD
jgi:hypothetical protein